MKSFIPFGEKFPQLLKEWDYTKNHGLDPSKFSSGSQQTVWWKCSNPNHPSWPAIIGNRARLKKARGCPYCSGLKVILEESIAVKFHELMKEWHPTKNSKHNPYEVHPFGLKPIWWKCHTCGYEWVTPVRNRTKTNSPCPECKKIEDRKKSLKVIRPDVAEEWDYEKNAPILPEDVPVYSNEKVWWICKICFNNWPAEIKNRTIESVNSGCPICSRDEGVLKAKINLSKKDDDDDDDDYNYEIEDKLSLQEQRIQDIFRNHLKMEPWDRTIEELLTPRIYDKIDYEPYYQRKYVWDNIKATYLIESILIGTEIPPLIIFDFKGKYEIIDGRQRFETIKRFYHREFSLNGKGLYILKFLEKIDYKELDDKLKKHFYSTSIRIIKFSLVNESSIDEEIIDLLKKEIFRRYNSGITPLRRAEIEKAIYIHDDPTNYFKNHLKTNTSLYKFLASLFLAESDQTKLDSDLTLQKLLQKIRFLLIASEMPISTTRNTQTFEEFYNRYSEKIKHTNSLYKDFLNRIKVLKQIREGLVNKKVKTNRYINEVIFWGVSILNKESINLKKCSEENFINELSIFFTSNDNYYVDDASQFLYKNFLARYDKYAVFLESYFNKDYSLYLTNSKKFRKQIREMRQEIEEKQIKSIDDIRIEKTQPISKSVDALTKMLLRQEFLVRPSYQRSEVINKQKSSAIIESILLGIPLPPLFIYERDDGILEVVDGQQRLLSILGFIGTEFLDERGDKIKSDKHQYSLTKLKILEELNNKKYEELSEHYRDRILDYTLSLIVIKHLHNPNFDPVDLFVRLNNRPYPIKENTFEMWNSYVDKEIIEIIKSINNKYSNWFYLITPKNNKRMKNEELMTVLSYLEYRYIDHNANINEVYPFVDIFFRQSGIYIRVKQKNEVTKYLDKGTLDLEEKKKILKSLKLLESFLRKVKAILVNKDLNENEETNYLDKELTLLFNTDDKLYYKRRYHDFYALWYSSHFANIELINSQRKQIRKDLDALFITMKTQRKMEQGVKAIFDFNEEIISIRKKYSAQRRLITLSRKEKEIMLKEQNNICPLCKHSLFISDDLEVDHINPIAVKGKDSRENLQLTHKICNRKKGAKLIN